MTAQRRDQFGPSPEPSVARESSAPETPRELRTIGIPEFARRLGVSRWTIDRWIRQGGVLPACVDLPGRLRWDESVVDRFIAERTRQPRRFFSSKVSRFHVASPVRRRGRSLAS